MDNLEKIKNQGFLRYCFQLKKHIRFKREDQSKYWCFSF